MKKLYTVMVTCLLGVLLGACAPGEVQEKASSEATKAEPIVIYLVRHGKTWFNTTGQVQGFADTPLTEVGIKQAGQVGEALQEVSFTTAYASDLGRQRGTAEEILKHNQQQVPTLTINNGFREKNFGGFEGQPNETMWNTIMAPYGLTYKPDWSDYPKLLEVLGGEAGVVDAIAANDPEKAAENFQQVQSRAVKGIQDVVAETAEKGGGNTLIVSSGGLIPILLEAILPGEYQGEEIANCSITKLIYQDGQYQLETLADVSHLN